MLELLLVLLGIGTLFLWIRNIYTEDGVKCLFFSIAGFFALYVMVSACLFWMDIFTIERTLGILSGLAAISLGIGIWKKKLSWRWPAMSWREYWIPAVAALVFFPFVMNSFGFFGMAQDQGVYQTHAIYLMNGITDIQTDLETYGLLTDSGEQEAFVQMVQSELVGYYTGEEFGSYPTYAETRYESPVAGIFHGIPNFAALLALSGRILGVSHMAAIQLIFWVSALFFVYMTARNLRWNRMTCLLVVGVVAACPEIIWTVKSSLTEPFLMMLMAIWAYFLTEERRYSLWGTAAVMIIFSFFHVTAFIYVLMAYILFLVYYIRTGQRDSLAACGSMLVGFGVGITMMACVSPRYTYLNMSYSLYRILPFLTDAVFLPFIWGMILVGLAVLAVLYIRGWRTKAAAFLEGVWTVRLFRGGILGLMLCQLVLYSLQISEAGSLRLAFQQMSISAFAYVTGCLILPLTILLFLKNGKQHLESITGMMLCGAFFYCVLFYVTFLRPTTSYYYYARYLAPYVPLVAVCAGMCVNHWKAQWKGIILVISLLLVMPSNLVLLRQMDDTHVEWRTLEELASLVGEEDVLVLEKDDSRCLYLPLKAMTGARIHVRYGDLAEQMLRVKAEQGNTYYLSNGATLVDEPIGELVWKDCYQESQDFEDKGGRWIPFPTEFTVTERTLSLYRQEAIAQTRYEMSRKDFRIQGFERLEGDFRWTIQDSVAMEICLEPGDYRMRIQCMMGIPGSVLEQRENYEIQVSLDDIVVGKIPVSDGSQQEFVLDIPAEYIRDEAMRLELEIPLWEASVVTPEDPRHLGLPIQGIYFERLDQ